MDPLGLLSNSQPSLSEHFESPSVPLSSKKGDLQDSDESYFFEIDSFSVTDAEPMLKIAVAKAQSEQASVDKQEDALKSLLMHYQRYSRWEEVESLRLELVRLKCSQRSDIVFETIQDLRVFYTHAKPTKFTEIFSELKSFACDSAFSSDFYWRMYEKIATLCYITKHAHLLKALLKGQIAQLSESDFSRWKSIHLKLFYKLQREKHRIASHRILWTLLKACKSIDLHSIDTHSVFHLFIIKSKCFECEVSSNPNGCKYHERAMALIHALSHPIVSAIVTDFSSKLDQMNVLIVNTTVLQFTIDLIHDRGKSETYMGIVGLAKAHIPGRIRDCVKLIKIAVMHDRWESAAQFLKGFRLAIEIEKSVKEFETAEMLKVQLVSSQKLSNRQERLSEIKTIRRYYR